MYEKIGRTDQYMIEVRAAGLSTPGRVREHNEDSHAVVSPEDPILLGRKGHLLAIADGLGGQDAGEVASDTAIRAVVESYYAPTSPGRIEPALQHAVQVANLKVHEAARNNPSRRSMQTTLTCLVLAGQSAYVAHVGDTRVYLRRGESLTLLTNDHSEAAELVRMRLAKPESLAEHPRRNVLTRTIGSQLLLRPDFRRVPVAVGDTFVICTDGLWSEVADLEISRAAECDTPNEGCRFLIDLQLGRASLDNATVQMVKVVALDEASGDSEGWLNTIVNRFVGPRSTRDSGRSGRGQG
jgi:protein phosphatase